VTYSVEDTLNRLMVRGGPPFQPLPVDRGLIARLWRLLGAPHYTHYYDRLNGSRVLLTSEEASGIAPIELEMLPKEAACRMMRERQDRKAGGTGVNKTVRTA
jgi:hypothetical protein